MVGGHRLSGLPLVRHRARRSRPWHALSALRSTNTHTHTHTHRKARKMAHVGSMEARHVGQIAGGANYAPAYPGENVEFFTDLAHATMLLDELPLNDDAQLILWRTDQYESEAEAIVRTLSGVAEADYLLTVGPRGGIKRERLH